MPKVNWTKIAHDFKQNWSIFLVVIAISAITFGKEFQHRNSNNPILMEGIDSWPIFIVLVILGFALRFAWRGWITFRD